MGILDLRLELETALSSVLGTYTLANGCRTPAISVRPEGTTFTDGRAASGLECVLIEEPVLRPIRQYRLERAFAVWTVELLQWGDLSTGEALHEVAARILYAYPGSTFSRMPVGANAGPKARMRLEIVTNPDAT